MLLLILAAIISGSQTGGLNLLDECLPTCPVSESKVPDPTNCFRYFYCLNDGTISDFYEECPPGMYFDESSLTCTSLPASGSLNCTLCEPQCKFECPGDSMTLVANGADCGSYLACIPGGDPIPLSCDPLTPYFNGITCTNDSKQCCDPCRPYCENAYTEIPDPTNCTNFYYCKEEGFPTEADLHHCPSNLVFSRESHHCEEGAPCSESCSSGYIKPTTAVPSDCVNEFICRKTGFFPKCQHSCDPHYYYCSSSDIGHKVEPRLCPDGKVLNPLSMYCVRPADCPFRHS